MTSIAFEHATLHLLDAGGGPQGSGTLMERLGDLGFRVSEPTVGRFLRTLDRRGLTTRVSNKGRGLTEAGRQRLEQLCEADAQLYYERELVRTIRSTTFDEIMDVLVARRALEGETAASPPNGPRPRTSRSSRARSGSSASCSRAAVWRRTPTSRSTP